MKQVNLLRITLKINAGFSAFCGITLIIFYANIALYMNLQNSYYLLALGIGLLGFVGLLFKTANSPMIQKSMIQFIIVQDWIWVVSSVLVIGFQAFGINKAGFVLIGIVALIVAVFAIIQHWLLRKI